jgi:hypothetical protein
LGKLILNYNAIKDDILSPGKIIWHKKSDTEVVISSKYSFLNLSMIEKLINGGHNILIEDNDETHVHAEFEELFLRMKGHHHIKDKIIHRNKIINLLKTHYIDTPRTQDDLNQLAWRLFSTLNREEATTYLNRDINLFKRAMSVASSFAFCAFLMGHYDNMFLKNLYTTTFKNLMNIGNELLVNSLKEKLESLRVKIQFDEADKAFIKTIDSTGIMELEIQDLNNLELIVSSLNAFFQWDQYYEGKNLLSDICEGKFKLNPKVVDLIKENLLVATNDRVAAA